jgi:hypothetical protein
MSSFAQCVVPAESEEGPTSTSNVDEDVCPLCLDPMPRRAICALLLCCGKRICDDCKTSLFNRVKHDLLKRGTDASQRRLQGRLSEADYVAEANDLEQQLTIANKCPMCRHDLPQDPKESFQIAQRNAELHGWAWAQFNHGLHYKNGDGVPVTLTLAAHWFRKAAEQGYPDAQHEYGECLQDGKGVPERNIKEACKWWYEQAISATSG